MCLHFKNLIHSVYHFVCSLFIINVRNRISERWHICHINTVYIHALIKVYNNILLQVYRSFNPVISFWFYLGLAPRAILAVFPVLNLILNMESSAIQKLSKIFKCVKLIKLFPQTQLVHFKMLCRF